MTLSESEKQRFAEDQEAGDCIAKLESAVKRLENDCDVWRKHVVKLNARINALEAENSKLRDAVIDRVLPEGA
jgi:hypothetical protein